MANIVVFGKAHSGKSTLIGYIHSLKNDYFYTETKLKDIMGSNYDASMFYAYQLDDSKNERSQQIEIRGSHIIHIRKTTLSNNHKVTLIDTPGREHFKKQKEKGIYYGDIGIFCLELSDVASDNFLTEYNENKNNKEPLEFSYIMSSLILWSSFANKKIIVVLTKSDLCDYSEALFRKAEEKVHKICKNANINSIEVIPIAIIVNERKGHNINEKTDKFNWYSGKTLCDIMEIENQNVFNNYKKEGLLFCINKKIARPLSHVGKIWIIKILQGQLYNDDIITLAPVLNDKNEIISIEAKIKKIREDIHKKEKENVTSIASHGNIVGLDLYDINYLNKRIQKKDFEFLPTTCGFNYGVKFDISNYFSFLINIEYLDIFNKGRQYCLIWFGKAINFSIQDSYIKDKNKIIVNARLIKNKIALPLASSNINEKYYFNSIIIQDSNKGKYFVAELITIGGEK